MHAVKSFINRDLSVSSTEEIFHVKVAAQNFLRTVSH